MARSRRALASEFSSQATGRPMTDHHIATHAAGVNRSLKVSTGS